MVDSTFDFSKAEMTFLKDTEFLLTKIEIGRKVEYLLGRVEQRLQEDIESRNFPSDILVKSGKISKGDNYKNLPYYVLDFPRKFENEGIFAFRTMFWWGNFFSATLHLAGKYLESHRKELINNIENIKSSKAYVCVNKIPWEYDYEGKNYLPASQLSDDVLQVLFNSKSFVKISYRWELEEYTNLPELVLASFRDVLKWI